VTAVGAALGIPEQPGRPLPDILTEALGPSEPVLVVLDNCEHVVEAAATLAGSLLGRCPRLRVLATSREALRIDGETLHPVLPLELPEPGATDERARACAAVRLFHDRAAAVRPGFTPEGGALTAAVEICRRLDGLPLAIELAAARLRALPVEAVAARLDDRFRLLTGGSRTALPRHRTLSAAVAWSWDLLDTDERSLLERLAVVPGSFTEDAAEAIGGLGDVRELLTALVDKSLLHSVEPADPVEPRYRVLETIREYGLARLARRDEVDVVRGRHARFFLQLAETADPFLRTSDQLRWLARLSAEQDNLSAAIRWAVESGDADLAARFGVALCWYWFLRDHPPESLDLLGRVLQVPGSTEPQARALVVVAHALATTETVSRPEEAESTFDQIRKALECVAPGTHPILEMARLALAVSAGPDEAVPDEWTDPWSRSLALMVHGVLVMNTGHAAEATHLLSRALTGFEELGERWGLAITLSTLNAALRRSGAPAGAPALVDRATRYFQELGMPEHTMESEVAAALHRAEAGDVDGGRRQLTALLDQVERAGSAESRAQLRLGLARLEWRACRPGPAGEHARAGLAEAPSGRSTPHLTALLLGLLAQVDVAEGVPDQAVRRLDHPAVHMTLTWHTPVAAAIAVVAAAIELCHDRPERAGRLLGAATVLRGREDLGDDDVRTITQRATAALGAAGFAAAHAAGAAMSRAEAEDLVAAVITAPSGPRRPR
jgi:predicted ATPase